MAMTDTEVFTCPKCGNTSGLYFIDGERWFTGLDDGNTVIEALMKCQKCKEYFTLVCEPLRHEEGIPDV